MKVVKYLSYVRPSHSRNDNSVVYENTHSGVA
jgi:hypothetical protein